MRVTADRSLYLTADKAVVVEESSHLQAFLLVGKGCEIEEASLEPFGLVWDGQKIVKAEDSSRDEFTQIDGIGDQVAAALRGAGYESMKDLHEATDDEILGVAGIGASVLRAIREHFKNAPKAAKIKEDKPAAKPEDKPKK